jgi:hypothetical protein
LGGEGDGRNSRIVFIHRYDILFLGVAGHRRTDHGG